MDIFERIVHPHEPLLPVVKASAARNNPESVMRGPELWARIQTESKDRLAAMTAVVDWRLVRGDGPLGSLECAPNSVSYAVTAALLADEEASKFWAYGALLRAHLAKDVPVAAGPRLLRVIRELLNTELVELVKLKLQPEGPKPTHVALQAACDHPGLIQVLQRWRFLSTESQGSIALGVGFPLLRKILSDCIVVLTEIVAR